MFARVIFKFVLICFIMPLSAFAAIDKEVAESLKCTRMFPYHEKKHNIPADTLHSIALKESGKSHSQHKIRVVWPWAVNVGGQSHYFDSKREAVLFVRKQMLSGKENIDVGCMQINLKHHPKAFVSLEHAFDPRMNVAYGAEFLKSKHEQLGCWHKAIAHYHSATHALGFKYKQDVIKIASNMGNYKDSLRKYAKTSASIYPTRQLANTQNVILNNDRRFNRPPEPYQTGPTKNSKYSDKNKTRFSQARTRSNLMVPVYNSTRTE